MNKIDSEHLSRRAFVYVRQSTLDQVRHNRESQLRQYGLADRARTLGWPDVTVIDDDLGRSGSGIHRPGSNACWSRCAAARSALYSVSKRRAWRATVAIGTRFWNSAVLLDAC